MTDLKLKIMVVGAHPDDCDGKCGGLALTYARLGHRVAFVSMTDGSAGHYRVGREALAKIRKAEAETAAEVGGLEYQVLPYPDGRLEVNIDSRETLLRVLRRFSPDIIITNRPNDYHPDHRYTSQLVQDASFLIMVPNVCPDTPAMKSQPAIFYMSDDFKRPYAFCPDVVIDIGDVIGQKLRMVSCHKSQYSEWLPWIGRLQGHIPEDYDDRQFAYDRIYGYDGKTADQYRSQLIARYGKEKGVAIRYAEAFEMSEYGRQLSYEEMNEYFPR